LYQQRKTEKGDGSHGCATRKRKQL
jgi:hypothetical protein